MGYRIGLEVVAAVPPLLARDVAASWHPSKRDDKGDCLPSCRYRKYRPTFAFATFPIQSQYGESLETSDNPCSFFFLLQALCFKRLGRQCRSRFAHLD
jgi:hypothetical protein